MPPEWRQLCDMQMKHCPTEENIKTPPSTPEQSAKFFERTGNGGIMRVQRENMPYRRTEKSKNRNTVVVYADSGRSCEDSWGIEYHSGFISQGGKRKGERLSPGRGRGKRKADDKQEHSTYLVSMPGHTLHSRARTGQSRR